MKMVAASCLALSIEPMTSSSIWTSCWEKTSGSRIPTWHFRTKARPCRKWMTTCRPCTETPQFWSLTCSQTFSASTGMGVTSNLCSVSPTSWKCSFGTDCRSSCQNVRIRKPLISEILRKEYVFSFHIMISLHHSSKNWKGRFPGSGDALWTLCLLLGLPPSPRWDERLHEIFQLLCWKHPLVGWAWGQQRRLASGPTKTGGIWLPPGMLEKKCWPKKRNLYFRPFSVQIPTRIPEKIVVALFSGIVVNSGIQVEAGRHIIVSKW